MLEAISAIDSALTLVRRMREVNKKLGEAEFSGLLADLAIQLADAKAAIAGLKNEVADLNESNQNLKRRLRARRRKPKIERGCYMFPPDTTLYCPACYDTIGEKYLTVGTGDPEFRKCVVCKTTMSKY